MELHVRQRKGAEALTRAAAEPQTHRFGWSSVAPNARDLSRDPRAHGEVMVPDLVRAVERLAALEDLGIERYQPRAVIAVDRTPARRQRFGGRREYRWQIERLRPRSFGALCAL